MAEWACVKCTYLNNESINACEICANPKSNEPPKHSIEDDYALAKQLQERYNIDVPRPNTPQSKEDSSEIEIVPNHNSNTNSNSNSHSNLHSNSNSNSNTISNISSIAPQSLSPKKRRKRKRKRHQMAMDSDSNSDENNSDNEPASKFKLKEEMVSYTWSGNGIIGKITNDWFPGAVTNEDKCANAYLSQKINLIPSNLSISNPSVSEDGQLGTAPIESIVSKFDTYKIGKKTYYYNSRGVEIIGKKYNEYPSLIIDLKDVQVAIGEIWLTQPDTCRRYYTGHNYVNNVRVPQWSTAVDAIESYKIEGSNDGQKWRYIYSFTKKDGYTERDKIKSDLKWDQREYYTKFRIILTAPNSSGRKAMRIKKIKLFGNTRRKAYKINQRIGELSDFEPFPKISANRCIGDPNNVFKILDEWTDIRHGNYDEFEEKIPGINVQLKDYQKKGVSWLVDMENNGNKDGIKGGLLCDEMGLGKTVQMIALMLIQRAKKAPTKDRTIIITPLSLIDQWIDELSHIAKPNTFKIINYYGSKAKKLKKKDFQNCDVCITTTQTFASAMGKLKKRWDDYEAQFWYKQSKDSLLFKLKNHFFDRIVIDEAHEIKNTNSVRSDAICTFAKRCKYKWCLTATPVSNDLPVDLSGMSRFLGITHEKYTQSLKVTETEKKENIKFDKNINKPQRKNLWLDLNNEYCMNKIKKFIKPLLLRRTKKQCLSNGFPPKQETIIKYELSEEERVIYNKNVREALTQYKEFKAHKSVKARYMHLLKMITKLRKLCDHPCLVFNKSYFMSVNHGAENVMDLALNCDVLERMHTDIVRRINAMDSLFDYECPICYELTEMNGVILQKCGHCFCYECCNEFEKHLCAICRQRFSPTEMIKIVHILKSKKLNEKHKSEHEEFKVNGSKSSNEASEMNSEMSAKYDEFLQKYSDPLCMSSKVAALITQIKSVFSGEQTRNDKILVFSNFTPFFQIIGEQLKVAQIRYLQFDGTLSRKKRKTVLSGFNNSNETKILLISAKCASVGLNLMCANHVFFVDPRSNPSLDNQAIGRCWRIGQKKTVFVTRFIMENTMEERILSLQQNKGKNGTANNGSNLKQKSKLTETDYDYLFEYKEEESIENDNNPIIVVCSRQND